MGKRRKRWSTSSIGLCFVGLSCLAWLTSPYFWPLEIDVSSTRFNGQSDCPACYGESLCPDLFMGRLNLTSRNRYTFLHRMVDTKNAFEGTLLVQVADATAATRRRSVVVKKLVSDAQLKEHLTSDICRLAKRPPGYCNPAHQVKFLTEVYRKSQLTRTGVFLNSFDTALVDALVSLEAPKIGGGSGSSEYRKNRRGVRDGRGFWRSLVGSQSLLDHVVRRAMMHPSRPSLENVLTTLLISPEPLLFATFPSSEGWPFPEYIGNCGLLVLLEDCGPHLVEVASAAPLQVRARLALQVLDYARKLTDNRSGLALYLLDWNQDHFSVDSTGRVRIVGVPDVVIVNRTRVREVGAPGWNVQHTSGVAGSGSSSASYYDYDGGFSDLGATLTSKQYSVEDLKTHDVSDHNIYGVCKWLLSKGRHSAGLLAELPANQSGLERLIDQCVEPTDSMPGSRFKAANDLVEALKLIAA